MTARNQPCPCGSGKKFKHCHGRAGGSASQTNPQQLLMQARQLLQQSRLDEALNLGRQLPEGLPKYQLLVHIYMSKREPADLKAAAKVLEKWTSADQVNPEPVYRLLDLHLFREDLPAAAGVFKRVKKRAPETANTYYYSALIKQLSGDLSASMEDYLQAVKLGSQIQLTDREYLLEAAIEMYETAAGQYPGSPNRDESQLLDREPEYHLFLQRLESWQEEADLEQLTDEQRTRYGNGWYNLGCTTMGDFGRTDQTLGFFHHAVAINPDHELARLNYCFTLNYDASSSPEDIYQAHKQTGDWLRNKYASVNSGFYNTLSSDRKIRIAYLSSDFRNHSVAHFILPVLEAHDRSQFEVILYYNDHRNDVLTKRAQRCADAFKPVKELDDTALYHEIINDRIDILIDLNGLTKGHRMGVLARRAAPIQVNWIGYPNTTGLDTVDYRIVDGVTDPEGVTLASEELLRLPEIFSVYEPPDPLPEPAAMPCEQNTVFTFGSFNHLPKINDPLLDTWSDILKQVEHSRLLIKNILLGYGAPRQRLVSAFKERGIAADRLVLVGRIPDKAEHMKHYHQVDLCLDSVPYNGTTTTCDSLIMEVPVLTVAGADHRSRVSMSQLRLLGLDELIAKDLQDYVAKAASFARSPETLKPIRHNLRQRMLHSPLMDARKLTRALEDQYRQIWRKYCTENGSTSP